MADLIVAGGRVHGGELDPPADVVVRDGRIVAIEEPTSLSTSAPNRLEAGGMLVAPGFVDLQCNGIGGIDLARQPERLWEVGALLPRWGVTAWLPTIVSSPASVRLRAQQALRGGPPDDPGLPGWRGAVPLGLHLEGPFIAPERRGAHALEHLRVPATEEVDGWSAEAGIGLVTLAPELPGALDVVQALSGRDVVVSLGHSSASVEEGTAAVDAGARAVTHLFNAMAPWHHRSPGLAAVALTDERLVVGAIADGIHLHPATVALVARAAGPRLALVTDAVAALGLPPGPVRLGDVEARVDAGEVRLADGTLAGSTLSMDRAVANLVEFTGCAVDFAVAAASTVPSRLLGHPDRGEIAVGARADIVVLEGAEVAATVVGGEVVYQRPGNGHLDRRSKTLGDRHRRR